MKILAPAPVVELKDISKAYGKVLALDQVSARFFPNEVHCVLGENGAGKSTLMGILAGFVVPERGSFSIRGEAAPVGRPERMKAKGFAMVHQHFMLVPNFTVAENLCLIDSAGGGLGLDPVAQTAKAVRIAKQLGWDLDLSAPVANLPVGVQQRVEILKALVSDPDVLILDEPTAVLSEAEVEDLFQVLCRLRGQGKSIVLIAHKLDEVLAVADRVTVLRKGKFVAESLLRETNKDQLAEWMVGEIPPVTQRTAQGLGEVVAEARDLEVLGDRGQLSVKKVSLTLRAGEILGIGGVDGNGQIELAEAVVGIRAAKSGTITGPSKIGFIPQDRQAQGLALGLSIRDNLLVGGMEDRELSRGPFWRGRSVKRWAQGLVEQYEIKIGSVKDPVGSLSGGNQQKVIVSRVMSQKPPLIVAVNPTRGLDIRATEYVHRQLLQAASGGAAVLLVSTDRDELLALSHTIRSMESGVLGAAE